MSDIDISQRTIVQEGHFSAELPGIEGLHAGGMRRADYRVSFAPAMFGQKLVVRIFDAANAPLKVNDLQLPPKMLESVKRELQKETGMLLVCGPTGSGKTTTLYALVRSSDITRHNVVTIEDPIEVQLEGVTQIQTDEAQGKTFGACCGASCGRTPTPFWSAKSATPKPPASPCRPPSPGTWFFQRFTRPTASGRSSACSTSGSSRISSPRGCSSCLAQRLVRRLCQFCRRAVEPTEEQRLRMGPEYAEVSKVYEPRGCSRCLNTGYGGRQAFFELLTTTDKLRDVIVTTRTMEDIKKAIVHDDFVTLQQSGYDLVAAGIASFEEIETSLGR